MKIIRKTISALLLAGIGITSIQAEQLPASMDIAAMYRLCHRA